MYQTRRQITSRRESLDKAMAIITRRSGQMIQWFKRTYLPAPEHEKKEMKKAWDEYYKQCSQSVEAELYRATCEAFKAKDIPRFKELVSQARQMLKNGITHIPKPSGYDPNLWSNGADCAGYRILQSEIDRISGDGDFDSVVNGLIEKPSGTTW